MFAYRSANHSAPLLALLIAVIVILEGCATVDLDGPKEASYALQEAPDTYYGREVPPIVAAHPADQSGFLLQPDGIQALAARFRLAAIAEETLDAQYYLITNDMVGMLFIGSLLRAADRGVRVRLLLDDIQTKGYDTGIAALDSHPNFTVRIFNPWSARSARALNAGSFSRLNRRMHNKSFTADNQITIIGGRNIADEYFAANKKVNFGDVDVLALGPVVQDVSKMFDTYWNSRYAAPAETFAKMPDDPAAALVQLRARIERILDAARDSKYGTAVKEDYEAFAKQDADALTWATYELAYDSPDKANKKTAQDAEKITTKLAAVVDQAQDELLIISPYFVPQKSGEKYFQGLIDRGLKVTVLTNSLAANNHGIVHSGYMGSRKALLKMGVDLWEIKVTAEVTGVDRGGSGAALATLHTKAFVVDRQHLFVGSFNWDPRSVYINTELGVIINSPEMAGAATDGIEQVLHRRAYQVVLNEKGNLRWLDNSGDETIVLDKEPDTSWWRRTTAQMGRILPVRGQL
jgi:putative cardiolipin synthase